jgi:sugar phosphate permease
MDGSSQRKPFHWAWVILIVCFLDIFVNYSIRLGYGVVLPEMIRTLDLNRTQGGSILNFYLAAYLILTPFTGNLTDRLGARRIIPSFGLLLGLGALLMGTVDGFWTACIFFGLVGAGASAMWTPVLVVVQRWFSPRRRGMALGILSTGYGLGFAAMGWIFPILVEAYSWRFCWYVLGSAALVMVLLNGGLLRSRPEDMGTSAWGSGAERATRDTKPTPPEGQSRYGSILRSPAFWLIGVSYFFAACALYIVTTFMVDYASVELGLGFKTASFLATVHGLSQVAGVLTIPMLSDRIGRRWTLVGSNLFIGLAILGVVVSAGDVVFLYASVGLFGVFYGATWPLYGACAGDHFPQGVMGTVIGAWTPLYGLGAILANFLAGRIRDLTGSFQAAFLLAVLLALAASFLMSRVKPR